MAFEPVYRKPLMDSAYNVYAALPFTQRSEALSRDNILALFDYVPSIEEESFTRYYQGGTTVTQTSANTYEVKREADSRKTFVTRYLQFARSAGNPKKAKLEARFAEIAEQRRAKLENLPYIHTTTERFYTECCKPAVAAANIPLAIVLIVLGLAALVGINMSLSAAEGLPEMLQGMAPQIALCAAAVCWAPAVLLIIFGLKKKRRYQQPPLSSLTEQQRAEVIAKRNRHIANVYSRWGAETIAILQTLVDINDSEA